MLLRKYVDGGRIMGIDQVGRERICRIRIGVTDELGNPAEFVLLAEVMGKHSNVMLLNPQGRIVDAARRVTEEVNRHREVLPGLSYIAPPPTGKLDPDSVTAATFAQADPNEAAWKAVLDLVDALGPTLAKEAVVRAGAPPEAPLRDTAPDHLAAAVRALSSPSDFAPHLLYTRDGRLKDFHVLPLQSWEGTTEPSPTVSRCLDAFYGRRDEDERFGALKGSLAKLLRDETGRLHKKLALQETALARAENAEELRMKGELITADIWRVSKGDHSLEAENYYDPDGALVTVALDPTLSPSENAQAYYRRYQKARSGLSAIREQIGRSREELAYLEQVDATLTESRSLPDLEEVRRELIQEGYLGEKTKATRGEKTKATRGKKAAAPAREDRPAPPLSVRSSDGLEIWIGRNNRQNDYLTTRLAAPTDYWFHTKEIAGAHVILRVPPGGAAPERALHEAAALAAWYSKGRGSSQVPVDYTLRKHVRKPNGARPGMVIYENQKTLYVTPDPAVISILGQLDAQPGQ